MRHDSTFSIKEALEFGWSKTRANMGSLLVIGVIATLLAVLQRGLSPNDLLLQLMTQLMQIAVMLAWIRAALRLHDADEIDWSRPLDLLDDFLPFLLTATLVTLIVAAGFVLLIVPGVIWGLRYGFSPFVVADRKPDPVSALRESARLTSGIKGHLFGFALAMLGLNLLGAMAFGVGLLLTVPTTWIASAFVFRKLQARVGHGDHGSTKAAHIDTSMPVLVK